MRLRARSWRRAAALAALLLGGTTLGLAAGELAWRSAARLAPAHPPAPRPTPPAGLQELTSVFAFGLPNVRGLSSGAFFRTNSSGFRGREFSETPADGVRRIVVVGDSVTMGVGVLEEETYSARVEAGLNAGAGGVRYEVLNLGLAGSNIDQVAARLESLGLRFHPDLIVYGFTVNDIEGPAYENTSIAGPAAEAHARRFARFRESRSYLLRSLWPRWVSLWDVLAPAPGSYEYDVHHNYFRNPVAWEAFVMHLDRLAAIGHQQGVCVHMVIHTTPHYLGVLHPFRAVYERVATAARRRGLTVSESFPYFRGRDEGQLTLSAIDPHPNAAGHELLAEALLAGLRSLAPECWRSARAPE